MKRSRFKHGSILLLWIGALGVASSAIAAEPVLIVQDTGDKDNAEGARSKVQLLTGIAITPEKTLSLDDLVAETGYRALTSGGVSLFTCKGPALDAAGFDARLADAVRLVDELDLGAASSALDTLRDDLPCSVAAIPARQLHDLFFFSGLMAAYNQQKKQAINQFSRAASLKPDVRWNESYGPSAQQLFLLGKEQSLSADPVTLTVVPPPDARRVWLDGRETEDFGPMVARLRAGTHVIHVETASGAIRAVGLDLTPGPSLWSDTRAAAAAVLAGEIEGPASVAAVALLQRGAVAWEVDTIYVSTQRGVLRWTPEGIGRPAMPMTPVGDRVSVRFGGGLVVREAAFRKPFAYVAPSLEVDIGIVRGLEATIFARVGMASFSESTLSVLPVWGAGLQWAFAGVTIKPFVGAQAAFIARQKSTIEGVTTTGVGVGALARIGAIISPIRRAPLRLGLGLNFGWIDGLHASMTATVGIGVRPKPTTP